MSSSEDINIKIAELYELVRSQEIGVKPVTAFPHIYCQDGLFSPLEITKSIDGQALYKIDINEAVRWHIMTNTDFAEDELGHYREVANKLISCGNEMLAAINEKDESNGGTKG